ncbi:MAG: CPBP family intramembrane metalloprotease [Anaerolineaceae bacterium]|nr:MAG: CPBP family intramembrane metalloprotease [Anaerolineaceae bacterium]
MKGNLRKSNTMTGKTLIPFLAITFGLSWSIAAIVILFYDQVIAIFGEISVINPIYILMVYSPGIAGVFLVWWHYRTKGLGSFFKRLTLWRAPLGWWLFLILGIPAVVYTGAAIKGTISDPFPFSPWYQVLSALAIALFLGPIEEFGWRGLALPLLQRRFAPIWAGLILGITCAAWHIPAFFMSGTPMTNWSFVPYFGGVVAIYVILTPFFNASRGSLVVAYLYHFQMMKPIFPDAQPYDNILWMAVAVIVVLLNRRKMFRRGEGVKEVLMPEEEDAPAAARYPQADVGMSEV